MKKKLLLTLVLASMLIFLFVFAVSAATPEMYIEFGARFPGSDEYITVYTQNAEKSGTPRINFATYKFYSDVEFTEEVDISTVTGLDFSVAVSHNSVNPVNRMTKPESPFVNCTEVKWFTQDKAMEHTMPKLLFYGWTSLKTVDFGNATAIGDNTFEGCGLESITIPATIKTFANSAFANCKSLKSVTFEGSLDKIGSGTFNGCTALTSVDLGQITTLSGNMFKQCTALESVELPSTLTTINAEVFNGCSALTSITIPSSVTSIGSSAFKSTALTSITIPSSVESIGNNCFTSCSSLTSVNIEGDNTELGTTMFLGCGKLESITLPKNLERIPSYTFQGCSKVVIANISELTNLTTIGSDAFRDTSSLVFTLPDTVTTIEARAFQSAFKNGGSITINPTSKLTTIDECAFNGGTKLSSIYIPSTVTSIGIGAFQGCQLKSIENFENCQITTIATDTFREVTSLTSIKIPETVTTIENAFLGNKSLAKVYIPKSVTSIADTFVKSQYTNPSANAVYIYTGKDASVLSACTRLAGANVISSDDYDETATYTGINLVVGYSTCIAYNNGVHGDTELTALLESYYEPIDVVSKCTVCEMTKMIHQIPALFTYRGYSIAEEGASGIDIGFKVNREAIATYEGVTGEKLTYGIFAGLEDTIGTNDLFDADGKALSGIITADMTETDYSVFHIKMVGFSEAQKDTLFAMGAYVGTSKNDTTNYTYLQIAAPIEGAKYYFASYSDVLKLKNGN